MRSTDTSKIANAHPTDAFIDRQQLTRELLREMMDEMYVFIRSPFDETQPIRSVLESTRKYFEFYEAHRALLGVVVELSQTDA